MLNSVLPCQFCGETPEVLPKNPETGGNAWGTVKCRNKDCPVEPSVSDGEDVADERGSDEYKNAAIERWNANMQNSGRNGNCPLVMPAIYIDPAKGLISFQFEDLEARSKFINKYVSTNFETQDTMRYSADGKNITWVISELEEPVLIGPGCGVFRDKKKTLNY